MNFNKKWLFLITISLLFVFSNLSFVTPAEGDYVSTITLSDSFIPSNIELYNNRFYVLQSNNITHEYFLNGTYTGFEFFTNVNPYGIREQGGYFWVASYGAGFPDRAYKYYTNGTYTGTRIDVDPNGQQFTMFGGITHNDTFWWVLDTVYNKVWKFYINWTWTGESFSVDFFSGATQYAFGIETDSTYIWTTDFGQDKIHKMWVNGTYITNWSTSTFGANVPQDIVTDGVYFYISDTQDKVIYQVWKTDTGLFVNIDFPTASYVFGTNSSLDLNYTIIGTDPPTCYYEIYNSTGDIIVSNTTIINCNDTQFNVPQGQGDYILYLYVNNSLNETFLDSVDFEIQLVSPAINLEYPSNNDWLNSSNIWFNYTAVDTDGLGLCQLWHNYSGSWSQNYTWNSPTSGVEEGYQIILGDKASILWGIFCNDSLGNGGFSTFNYTFGIDTTNPSTTIDDIVTTQGSQTFSFDATSSDENGFFCRYTIFNLVGGVDSSAFYTCNAIQSPSVSSFASYILQIETIDLAGNTNATNRTFTVTASPSGGGGGGGGIVVETDTGNWTLETDTGNVKYELIMIVGTSRTKSLVFENKGTTSRVITIECQGELCDYVMLADDDIILPLSQRVKTEVEFTIMLPRDYPLGATTFDLVAEDEDGNKGVLTTTIDVRRYSLIKFLSSLQIGNFSINYFLLFILLGTLLYFVFNKVVFLKKAGSVGLSFLLSLILSIIIIMLV